MMEERAIEKGRQAIDTFAVAAKDPGKKHFYISLVKSGLRIVGLVAFIGLGIYANEPLFTFGSVLLLAAEVLGIAEEIV